MLAEPLSLPPIHVRHLSPSFQSNGQPKIKFVNPNSGNFDTNIRYAATLDYPMIKHKELLGRDIIIAGSGPSLNDPAVLNDIAKLVANGAILCGLKKAIRVLTDKGFKVDYSVTMDPGAHIACPERLYKSPGTKHILATSSDLLLFKYMLTDLSYVDWFTGLSSDEQHRIVGCQYDLYKQKMSSKYEKEYKEYIESFGDNSDLAPIIIDEWLLQESVRQNWGVMNYDEWLESYIKSHKGLKEQIKPECKLFHSACGLPNEVQLYNEIFSDGWVAGGGFNVTNRAAAAFLYMGVNRLIFAGADSGWREGQSFYADGQPNRAGVDMMDGGKVDGTPWWTRPDMLASGVALARLAKELGFDRVQFLGDVMPAKLIHKDEEFLQNCVSFQK